MGFIQTAMKQVLESFQRQNGVTEIFRPADSQTIPQGQGGSDLETPTLSDPQVLGEAFQNLVADPLGGFSFDIEEWMGWPGDMFSIPDSGYGSLK